MGAQTMLFRDYNLVVTISPKIFNLERIKRE